MGLCCCTFSKRRILKDMSTQTDTIPLLKSKNVEAQNNANVKAKCKSSLETALRLVQQAVEEDRAHNYEEALSLYQHGLVYFLESLNYEAESENIKERILSKCKLYLNRAEKIAEYLNANNDFRRRKPIVLGEVSSSVARWLEPEEQPLYNNSQSRSTFTRIYRSLMKKDREYRASSSSQQSLNSNYNNSKMISTFLPGETILISTTLKPA
ncbi:vacuolar protein sorting-associated protein 4B-like [Clavelina lepadiformis]|uniref:MIT domain-containing protein n=1 Tax=Clavelina lepadiformis TaxID=159417 RepID=A0ABP0EYT9_CLALP